MAARLQAEGGASAPVFPTQPRPLSKLGSAQPHKNGWRAHMKVHRGEDHHGPLRETEAEAFSDLAEMRGAASRADVGSVAARLLAAAREAEKPLCELGRLEQRDSRYRARINVGCGEHHIGPLRDTDVEASSDLAEMRGATSRADVGLVAARLRANAATHRVHRETTQDAEAPLRADAATHRVHRVTTGGAEVPLRANAATHRGWPRLKRLSELGCAQRHHNGFRARMQAAR